MANPEHLDKLKDEDCWEWNRWRRENPGVKPQLSGARLQEEKLENVDLHGADLNGADLHGADLSRADLSQTDLITANLSGADLHGADLHGADLHGAELSGADLFKADLSGAKLIGAKLLGAKLLGADLTGANLRGTDLSGANLHGTRGFSPNETLIRNAKFEPFAPDWWSRLRRTYTGPKLLLNLLLLLAFFVPYVAQTMLWLGVNRSQETLIATTKLLNEAAEGLQAKDSTAAQSLGDATKAIAQLQPCLTSECKETPIWKVLLGVEGRIKVPFVGSFQLPAWWLTASLLLYNICRAALTLVVGPLREEEERSGYTPASRYRLLLVPHYIMSSLMVVALGSFVLHAFDWLTRPVWLPVI